MALAPPAWRRTPPPAGSCAARARGHAPESAVRYADGSRRAGAAVPRPRAAAAPPPRVARPAEICRPLTCGQAAAERASGLNLRGMAVREVWQFETANLGQDAEAGAVAWRAITSLQCARHRSSAVASPSKASSTTCAAGEQTEDDSAPHLKVGQASHTASTMIRACVLLPRSFLPDSASMHMLQE